MRRASSALLLAMALFAVGLPAAERSGADRTPQLLEWFELRPKGDPDSSKPPAAAFHDYLNEGGPLAPQVGSFEVNPVLNGRVVKVPGFIVPLVRISYEKVSEFLLVPYAGACVHVPPPPPNQVIYVKIPEGVKVPGINEPYWVTGVLTTQSQQTRKAAAAYSLSAPIVEPYE